MGEADANEIPADFWKKFSPSVNCGAVLGCADVCRPTLFCLRRHSLDCLAGLGGALGGCAAAGRKSFMSLTLRQFGPFWLAGIAGLAGCAATPRAELPAYRPQAAAQQALESLDANRDGVLDAGELRESPGLLAAMSRIDTSGDGRLSAEEISARVASYASAQTGFLPLALTILHESRPLADAQVTLTPEPLLATAIRPAWGTTNAAGVVAPKIEGSEFSGVNPGLYRIAVSRPDAQGRETLPERFNRTTILGIEAAGDIPGQERGVALDLK
jgi:hypothetical protein